MIHTYFGNSHCYVCITRPAPWRESVTGKNLLTLFRCALNTETINERGKIKVLRCSLKTPPQCHALRSIIKDYFFNCFSFWQIKNIYVNSALTSQFRYVCRMWVLLYCTTARSGCKDTLFLR